MIESHKRQMEIFGQNPNRIVKDYSHKFENAFLDGIKRSHLFGSVAATVVYNEFINDRHHVHINSIQWHSLTEFVKNLGQTGKCKVEETSKGWFMTYIYRDFETLLGMKNKRIKFDMSEEDKQDKEIEKQIEKAMHLIKQLSTIIVSNQPLHAYELAKVDPEANTMIRLSLGSCPKREGLPKAVFDLIEDVRKEEIRSPLKRKESSGGGKLMKTTLDELMREEEKKRERISRKYYWLHRGIIVKVMRKSLVDKGKYYKQKGVVLKVIDKYVGEIEMLETKHLLRVD